MPAEITMKFKKPIKWGILSTARIAVEKIIPAVQKTGHSVIVIAGRNLARTRSIASSLNIPEIIGGQDAYKKLLSYPKVDAIYNPLPNHLHVPLTLEAVKHGKHVLCEKPFGVNAYEVRDLANYLKRSKKKVLVEEAFMVKQHPQWLRVREMVHKGEVGRLLAIQGCFSYHNIDPKNIRNIRSVGGGGLYDIGCYLIQAARFFSGEEPIRVASITEFDPKFKTDRLVSALLVTKSGVQITWVCSTQMVKYQKIQILGTKKRIEIEIPFNAPEKDPCRIFIDKGIDVHNRLAKVYNFPVVNQYEELIKSFQNKLLSGKWNHSGIVDAINNMKVIDAIFQASKTKKWVVIR